MRCDKIIKLIEDWAPKEIAWEKDNVGLQVGSLQREIKNILLSLDVNERVVDEAIRKKCNLIITHHPLLFKPLTQIDTNKNKQARIIEQLIKKDITLYSAHTNLDFAKDGVSYQLAKKMGIQNPKILLNHSSNLYKLAVFVPISSVEKVAAAIHGAGAGIVGEYSFCSFRTEGTGTFLGSDKSNPAIGKRGKLEKVNEIKLEVLINSFDLNNVLESMKTAHPYEEIAYDVYPLVNENVNYGAGVIGDLEKDISAEEFLKHVSKSLQIKNFRFTRGKNKKIKKVAVCGGSGSELIDTAIKKGADAFVTADIKYHAFQDAEKQILLIDAGHYETEIPSTEELKSRLTSFLPKGIKVYKYQGTTNPIVFFNN